jgi:Ca-activated chloride channel homolog
MAGEVQLTASMHKDNFPILNQPQLGYVLVELMPTQAMANVQMPLNFCFVLDQSGSMHDDNKIGQLRDAVKFAIDQLQPDDIVSIVAFSSKPKVLVSGQPANDKNRLKREVDRLSAGGGTKMGLALRAGLAEVQKNLAPQRNNQIVILTDGQTENEDECAIQADIAARQGVKIIALGLGVDWNETLLMDVGNRSEGEAGFISQPHEIGTYFQQVVAAMQGAVVQNALLTLRLTAGITPRKVWRVAPLIVDLGIRGLSDRDVQVPLGEVVKNQGQGVLVELLLPPRGQGRFRIAQADLGYDVHMLGLAGEHVRADVVVAFTPDQALAAQVNPRVMNIIEKVTAFKMQTRALQQAQGGDRQNATKLLRQAATMLLNQGETDLARTMKLEADRLEEGGNLSEEGKKTIQFKGGKTVRLG